jgi:hypothetical protein
MRSLAEQETIAMKAHRRNPDKWVILRLDNIQPYIRQLDIRIGQGPQVNVQINLARFVTVTWLITVTTSLIRHLRHLRRPTLNT